MGHRPESWRKLTGDERDQRVVVREQFGGEEQAAHWAGALLDREGVDPGDELRALRSIRTARPGLTLRTATYVLRQVRTRRGDIG